MANVPTPREARKTYNERSGYYDAASVALVPGIEHFAIFAQPAFAESILDLGCASGHLLSLLIKRARTRQPQPLPPLQHAADEPGPFVAIDLAELFERTIRRHLLSAEQSLDISTCNAGADAALEDAVRMLINQDLVDHARPLRRGEARLYLGMGANFTSPHLMAHLAQKAPGGMGFDLITASHVLTSVTPADHVKVLQQWASALAPGGRLVVERSLYYPHPEAQGGLTCPGQMVVKGRTLDPNVVAILGHRQCAPDRFWEVCEQQFRDLAAKAGLNVTRLSWAGHGDAGAAMGGGFSNIWADEWEAELLAKMPEARDHDLVDLLCGKATEFASRHAMSSGFRESIDYNLVAVIAELRVQG